MSMITQTNAININCLSFNAGRCIIGNLKDIKKIITANKANLIFIQETFLNEYETKTLINYFKNDFTAIALNKSDKLRKEQYIKKKLDKLKKKI